jgi:hypothetical protein
MQGAGARAAARRRVAIGVVGVVAGQALVLVGVNKTMWIGAVGFALMVAAVAFALTPPRGASAARGTVPPAGWVRRSAPRGKPGQGGKGTKGARSAGSFMHRMEERWDRRRDSGF